MTRRTTLLMASMVVAMLLAGGVALALPSESPDQTLMVNGPVRTIEQVGNNVWVGGNFTQVQQRDGTVVDNVKNVAVFDAATGQYIDIAPMLGVGSTTTNVRDIDVYGDDVVIGGDFPGPSSTQRNLVVVDGNTGGLVRWYNSAKLEAVLAAPDLGRIYGGGQSLSTFDFDNANSANGSKPEWSRSKTSVDDTLRSHPLTAGYRDLERDGTAIWAACACDSVVGRDGALKASKSLVKLGADGYLDEGWTPPPRYQGQVQGFGISVSQADGALFLGAGGSDFLARFSKDPGAAIPDWVRDTSGQVQVVETMDGQLLVGGHFWEVSDDGTPSDTTTGIDRCGFRGPTSDNPNLDPFGECQTRKGLAAYSSGGALDPDWDPTYAGKFNLVWALEPEDTAQGTRLHTGGEFTSVSGVKQLNYARLSVDATPPTIGSVSPADGATEVAPDANAVATFSEAIDPSTLTSITFTLTKQDGSLEGTTVSASVSYDPSTKKATLDPDAPLDAQSAYTATVKGGTAGVKDSSANPLANDEVWSFTTTLPCTIEGTSGAETITGTLGDDVICAGAGNDTIQALEGNDTVRGEGGADQLHGGIGDDHLDGGAGTDTANFTASLAPIDASLADGTATGEGSDTISEVENLTGSNQPDTLLEGSEANNTLNGLGGADNIVGRGGADTLKGIGGNDTLDSQDGVEGNDAVDGGTGTDSCTTDATELSILSCEL